MKQKLNIDHVFSHIGEMGPQQIRYLVLMSVMTMYSPQFMIQVNQTRQSFFLIFDVHSAENVAV